MKVVARRDDLLELLGKLNPAVPKKSLLPVCTSVLLKTDQGKLLAVAHNVDWCLSGSCKAKVVKGGAICVKADPLLAFLKAVSAPTVTLIGQVKTQKWTERQSKWNKDTSQVDYEDVPKSHKVANFRIEAGTAATSLEGHPIEDFPPVPQVKGNPVAIPNLAQGLAEVDYAVANNNNRPVLEGVCFRPATKGKATELVATDGFRLAITTIKPEGTLKEMVVHNKPLKLVKQLMPGTVTIRQKEEKQKVTPFPSTPAFNGPKSSTAVSLASFEAGGLVLTVKPILGTFPNYSLLVPKTNRLLAVDRKALAEALKVIMAIKPSNNQVRLQTKGKNLIVSGQDGESKSEVKVPAKGKVQIAFDTKYLRDLLHQVHGDKLALRTTTPSAPALVKQNGTLHILMPVFMQWDEKKPAKVETKPTQARKEVDTCQNCDRNGTESS
jgi:DNA polymerase-3 subunit beta